MTVIEFETLDSTNQYAREHFKDLDDATVICARTQTAGRGRLGRVWQSPHDVNIYATMVMKHLESGFHAGCIAGLAGIATLREFAPEINFFLKWPNDIYVRDRKIAGILCESAGFTNGKISGVAAGIGININFAPEDMRRLDNPATSLYELTDRQFNLKKVINRLAFWFEKYYIACTQDSGYIFELWKQDNRLLGQSITVIDPKGQVITGCFRDISDDGAMLLEVNNATIAFHCGDVKIDRGKIDWDKINL